MSRNLAEAWFDAFRNRHIDQLERILAEDFVHTSPFGEFKPLKVYLDSVRANPEAFFSPVIEILDIFDCGDRVAVRYLVNKNPACDCIYSRDGRIARIFSYYHYGEKPVM